MIGLDHGGEVEPFGRQPRHERLEPAAALGPRQFAQVFALEDEHVVEPHEGGVFGEHCLRDGLAPEPLL